MLAKSTEKKERKVKLSRQTVFFFFNVNDCIVILNFHYLRHVDCCCKMLAVYETMPSHDVPHSPFLMALLDTETLIIGDDALIQCYQMIWCLLTAEVNEIDIEFTAFILMHAVGGVSCTLRLKLMNCIENVVSLMIQYVAHF